MNLFVKVKGCVDYEEDLQHIHGTSGDAYVVLYSGKRDDPPEKRKEIHATYIYAYGWQCVDVSDIEVID